MELVLSEPQIAEPVVCVFDGNGRMYVAEFRTYMQDIDGTGELSPGGRVSRHESTRGDGVFDKHTVFADKLLLPREVLPLNDRVLINETNTNDVVAYFDTKGTGVADKKSLFYAGGPRGGNLEHQQSGLVWGMDNWMYQAVNAFRLRYTGQDVVMEKTPGNGAQWGLAQDDYGKMWFSNGGAEKGPVKFQSPIIYGGFDVPGQVSPDYLEVWPKVGLADVQGGYARFRPEDKTLNHFTASCGQTIFRGDRLPADLRGDFLIGEPVGRLIRRSKVEDHQGMTYLRNAYDHSEFIRSTDPNFRPVNMTTGPDGCLYIVDMYRGIIQEGNWVGPTSYLRKVVQQYGMQNNFGRGRIWRLTHKDFKPGPQPKLLDETSAQLVAHLSHPNGWWRDTAQMLLVLRGEKSVVPALQAMARNGESPLSRVHALWALEGLNAVDAGLVHELLKSPDPKLRIQAIRVAEGFMKKVDAAMTEEVRGMTHDPDANVVLQVLLTGKLLNWPNFSQFAQITMTSTPATGVRAVGTQLLNAGNELDLRTFNKDEAARIQKGQGIYQELCFACHGYGGTGMPMDGATAGTTLAPPIAGSRDVMDDPSTLIHILLKGVTGPVGGKEYMAQMVSMESNDDEWVASIGSYVRNAFGNRGSAITPQDVAQLRAMTKGRTTPWTFDELHARLPQPVGPSSEWKVTASHNPAQAALLIDGKFDPRWESKEPLAPGMWVQVELPRETTIGGLWFDSGKTLKEYARTFTVQVSSDGQSWGKPVAQGKGTVGAMVVTFAPVKARYVRLTQTGKLTGAEKTLSWVLTEIRVLGPTPGAASVQASK